MFRSVLSPHQLIDHTGIALNNLHNLVAHILVHIVRHRDTSTAVPVHLYRSVHRPQKAALINTGENKASLIQSLRPFRTRADSHSWKRASNAREKARSLRDALTLAAVTCPHVKGRVLINL